MKGTTRTFVIVLAMATILATVGAGAAVAAKGGNSRHGGGDTTGGGGTISLVLLNGATEPHVWGKVTFNVSTTATNYPWVTLYCYQGGTLVYKASNGIFPTSLGQDFTLASNMWTSGEADCTAWLQNWDAYQKHGWIQNLASTSFHVYA